MRSDQSKLVTCGLHPNNERETVSSSSTPQIHQIPRYRLPSSLRKPSLRAYFDWDDSGNEDYTKRPILLDLFSGGGGAAMGYFLAGFRVIGVDVVFQPHYPFEFHQADALTYPLEGFDVIHASPPCQAFTAARTLKGNYHPDLLSPIRQRLVASNSRWVIENVPGAPMRGGIVLCGSQFGLGVRRHRWFEIDPPLACLVPSCNHSKPTICVVGHGGNSRIDSGINKWSADEGRKAMGINWMSRDELSQAIPPAYTEFIGRQLMKAIKGAL